MGLNENKNKVYMIDYGLAKKYIDEKTNKHIPYATNKKMIGTLNYCSINSQMGIEQGRKDDIESLGYAIIYMLRGYLPWQKISIEIKEERSKLVLKKKMDTTVKELCKGLPIQILEFMRYCRNLKYDEEPSYCYLHELLKSANPFPVTNFDWDSMKCDLAERILKDNNDLNEINKIIGNEQNQTIRIKNETNVLENDSRKGGNSENFGWRRYGCYEEQVEDREVMGCQKIITEKVEKRLYRKKERRSFRKGRASDY